MGEPTESDELFSPKFNGRRRIEIGSPSSTVSNNKKTLIMIIHVCVHFILHGNTMWGYVVHTCGYFSAGLHGFYVLAWCCFCLNY